MANQVKEEPVKPKPANVKVYIPGHHPISFQEGEGKVKNISFVSPNMVVITMEDGSETKYCGLPFHHTKFPQPTKKQAIQL